MNGWEERMMNDGLSRPGSLFSIQGAVEEEMPKPNWQRGVCTDAYVRRQVGLCFMNLCFVSPWVQKKNRRILYVRLRPAKMIHGNEGIQGSLWLC